MEFEKEIRYTMRAIDEIDFLSEVFTMTANEILSSACGTADPEKAPACGTQDPAPACGSADPRQSPACGTQNPAPACGTQDK